MLSCLLTTGLTLYWYLTYRDDDERSAWKGNSMDFILLAFAVVSPLTVALGMTFDRRERALIAIGSFRAWSYHLYSAHCLWDWNENGGRKHAAAIYWNNNIHVDSGNANNSMYNNGNHSRRSSWQLNDPAIDNNDNNNNANIVDNTTTEIVDKNNGNNFWLYWHKLLVWEMNYQGF
jgi:hypothetical protein